MPVSYGNRFQLKNYDNYYTKPLKPLPTVYNQPKPVAYNPNAQVTGSDAMRDRNLPRQRNIWDSPLVTWRPPTLANTIPMWQPPYLNQRGQPVTYNPITTQPGQVVTNNGLIGDRYQKGNKFWLKNADEAPGANPVIQEYLPAPATTDTSGGGYGYSSYGGGGYGGGSRGYSGSNYVNQWLNGLIKWNI
jgi:hypothetical protein